MTSQTQPTVALNDGAAMPQFGLGVFQTPPDATEQVVKLAVEQGYRSVDTASVYRNEDGVGAALLGRTDVFVTTKLGNSDYHGFDQTLRAFDDSMRVLAPRHARSVPDPLAEPAREPLCRELEGVRPSSKGRTGLLNRRLELQSRSRNGLLARQASRPQSTRSSFIRYFSNAPYARFMISARSRRDSWSPLGRGGLLGEPAIVDIAAKHHKTPAQVVIRWHLDSGLIVIPKTVRLERLKENIGALDFRLDGDDIQRIETLISPQGRIGPDPATAAF